MRGLGTLSFLLLAGSVLAADPAMMLRDARARLEASLSPDDRIVAMADAVAAHEASLLVLRATLRAMPARRQGALDSLGPTDGARLATLAALHRIERAPTAMRLLHPAGAVGAARGAMLVGDVAASLTRTQAALRSSLAALAAIESERRAAVDDVQESLAALDEARATMAEALSSRPRPEPREADRLLAAALAESTSTLDDLARLMDRLAPDTADAARQRAAFDAAVGSLPLPTVGEVLVEDGSLVISTLPYAVARAPWVSTVRHAGAVGVLGGVLVLEPAPGVLIGLRGLGGIDRQTADVVGAGEPLGHMGGRVPASEEFLIDALDSDRGGQARRLYIDVWRDGQAEQAAAWFEVER